LTRRASALITVANPHVSQMPPTSRLPTMNVQPLSPFRTRPDRALRALHLYFDASPFHIHLHRLDFQGSFSPNKRS
jgi:hypothetical protein